MPGLGSIYAGDEGVNQRPLAGVDDDGSAEARSDCQRVLIVDDQRLIADSLAEILGNEGFQAMAAYDGWEALEIARRFHPDWLVSDVLMPRMNGVDLAIAFRTRYPATAILLFSGQAGISEILENGKRHGYEFELIAKPVHPLRIIERLREK